MAFFSRAARRTLRRPHPALALLLAPLLAGCLSAQAKPRQDHRAAPNNTMSGRVSTCVRALEPRLRAVDVEGRRLGFTVRHGREPRCLGDKLRILRIRSFTVDGEKTFVRRGGCDRPRRGSRCAPQPTAHVLASDLADVPLAPRYRNGNGAPVSSCERARSVNPAAVGRELDRMFYKQPRDLPGRSIAGALWSNYGNPGRRFGNSSSTYVLWNLPRTRKGVLPGGGIVEAVLAQRRRVNVCAGTGIALPSFDRRGRRNGRVRFDYARVPSEGQTLFGWVLTGYRYRDRAFTRTLRGIAPARP
ncbi:MAG: hypothetical protein ACR2LK_14975 [Solirubrobacteraceae bacterium]